MAKKLFDPRERETLRLCASAWIDNARARESEARKIFSFGIAKLVKLEQAFFYVSIVVLLESLFTGNIDNFNRSDDFK